MRMLATITVALALLALPAIAQAGEGGSFTADCGFSHSAQVDPIVNFGQAQSAHLHDFAGNRNTNEFTTPQRLRLHPETTCIRGDEEKDPSLGRSNSSAMWVPAAYQDGTHVAFTRLSPIYDTGNRDAAAIRPFPFGLKVIAGSSSGGPQYVGSTNVYSTSCRGTTVSPGTATTAATCAGPTLRVNLKFQDCWDGVNLDSADHKSHMAYSLNGVCPSSHPVLVPQLKFVIDYPATGGAGFRFSSGPLNTLHGDYIPGWREGKQEQLVRDCLVPDLYCGGASAPEV